MNIKTDIPNLTDKEYYFLSQYTYDDKSLKESYVNKDPIETTSNKAFYVDKIKKDPDTGLDVYVFVQAKKKEGKWVKPKEPENVVVGFQGTNQEQIKADVISADGGNVVMG
ncbi:lipase, partial [Bacillus subtilis]